MIKISHMRVKELANILDCTPQNITMYFKKSPAQDVSVINNRILGISPEAIEDYLKKREFNYLYRPSIVLSANLCGGVGKTTSIYSLGAAMRRVTSRKTPIVFIDGDSQGSFTQLIFKETAAKGDPILIDFLEGKASIEQILTPIGDNIFFVKSNLTTVWIERILGRAEHIKEGMLRFYSALFDYLGNETKIYQDHTPQLSTLFSSSVSALHQLGDMHKAVIVPMRSDNHALQGADYIIKEIQSIKRTYSFNNNIPVHCFFSMIDQRVSTTSVGFHEAKKKESILNHLSPIYIRYCSIVTKSIQENNNIYSYAKDNNAGRDYMDLLRYIYDDKAHGGSDANN